MEITKEEFEKLNLVVGKIIDVSEVPKSDKLLKIKISIGENTKTVVSGIKKWYKKEELLGKKVILLENIKPAKFLGEISEGMILAASDGENVSLLTVDKEIKEGSKVS
ncbi:MAG: methionine--tRNA ligase subunit beta [Candidatus Rehaiarchaeum fermentans]|nr:methionine--tRNA ligase subunit beta [Candidatus Rehaiarchaeum fermentans]MCW1293384.1 methionine--tRNA ligase subunit beta [Candidatus Rehaiarchaeum fermentans]MCW1297142.1 methionine--tRNA ligase subunit beta [Candidatus Rehaiarchaeum fermentans]MCW1302037.1 methionine--tRNA ligase subunit beta [Candidatus Rehaiarchaeum fermentans]